MAKKINILILVIKIKQCNVEFKLNIVNLKTKLPIAYHRLSINHFIPINLSSLNYFLMFSKLKLMLRQMSVNL